MSSCTATRSSSRAVRDQLAQLLQGCVAGAVLDDGLANQPAQALTMKMLGPHASARLSATHPGMELLAIGSGSTLG